MGSLEDLELSAAIIHASKNNGELEHPWYGVWAIVLRKLCKIQKSNQDDLFIVPVIYPQDPVVHVPVNLKRQALLRQSVAPSPPSPNTRITGSCSLDVSFNLPAAPATPPPSNQPTMNALGSPLEIAVHRKRKRVESHSDAEDVDVKTGGGNAKPNHKSKAAIKFVLPPEANRNPDSRRYPDFSRIISFFAPDLPSPYEIRDLIVENKIRILLDASNKRYLWMHLNTQKQTREQAWHAFQSDKSLKTIGCIMAYGEFWTYCEYRREDVPEPATLTRGDDDEYILSDDETADASDSSSVASNSDIPSSALYEDISRLFDNCMWLKVGTEESDYMLCLIEKRLREINSYFWDQVAP